MTLQLVTLILSEVIPLNSFSLLSHLPLFATKSVSITMTTKGFLVTRNKPENFEAVNFSNHRKMAFKVILILEYFLLVMDILTNAFSDSFGDSVIHRLAIYVAQDLCLILSLIILFLLFFRTKILRNGLLQQLLKSNWIPFLVSITYITLTIVLQVLIVNKLSLIEEEARGIGDAEPRKGKVGGESGSESQLHSIGSTSTGLQKQSRNLDTKIDPRFWMEYPSIVTILVIQRITSALYYFTYRSAMMTLHDPNLIQRFNPIAIGSGTGLTSVSSGRLAKVSSTGLTTDSSRVGQEKWKE